MKIINNVFFKGNCRQAFERYAEILGGEIKTMLTFGDAPMDEAEECNDLIMHAWLEVGDQAIMGCDSPPQFRRECGGFSVSVHAEDGAEARRIFDALAEGGSISMPFQDTFWSPGFGMLTDRFGTPWLINTAATPSGVSGA